MIRPLLLLIVACGGSRAPAPNLPPTPTEPPVAPVAAAVPDPVAPPAPAPDGSITMVIAPSPAYVERTDGAQLVNCDLIVSNASAAAFTLRELEVSVFDRAGRLVFRKFVSGNGVSPSILTVPNRELAGGQRTLILNPLHTFPPDLELARLAFTATYQSAADQQLVATAEVTPRTFTGVARLVLPLRGRLIAWSGHDHLSHHRRWDYTDPRLAEFGFNSNAGRYSYDLIPVDDNGDLRKGDPADNASWFGFGRPVLAPAAGKVVALAGDHPDNREFDMAALKANLMVPFGNYLVIEHAPGEHSVLGHLKHQSLQVKVGDRVRAGQQVAAVGASGSSLMPHLHYQLQTTADGHAEGLPAYFHDLVKLRGARRTIARGHVDTGELVESRAKP